MASPALIGTRVSVTFIDQKTQTVDTRDVVIPTGSSGWDQRLTNACHDEARDDGRSTHWAQPYQASSAAPVEWLVFRLEDRHRYYCKTFPNREAAEVWVLHHEQ